ncbi:MerR family transcriptional regulator [bacterium]|jgi:DNA-binding transcriptional MerR regulator|nr:MerR family transcriptional regulator [bacterium]
MTRRMRLANGLLKIGEIAREAGLLASTIRYYTDMGLLRVVANTQGGYRLYDREDTLERIHTIKTINGRKWTLSEIKQELEKRNQ